MSHIGSGGAFKRMLADTAGAGTAVGVGGAWKSIAGIWVGVGGAWKKFFPAVGASASPASVSGERTTPGLLVQSNPTTCTGDPAGGTFSWEFVSGDADISADSPTNATTTFSGPVLAGTQDTASFRCRYTHPDGEALSNNVHVTLINSS